MAAVDWLPHLNAVLNGAIAALLVAGYVAIRRGRRRLHPRLMVTAVAIGACFLASYVVQTWLAGHRRFPGDDWVRTLFLVVLGTHTALAVTVVPLLARLLYLAAGGRLPAHRRLARIALPIWLYVATTGVLIYWMNNHLRPV